MNDTILRARLALNIRNDDLSNSYANELSKYGFRIIKITSRGVSFEGRVNLFETTFKSTLELSESECAFLTEPIFPEKFNKEITSIYFPTKPVFFK